MPDLCKGCKQEKNNPPYPFCPTCIVALLKAGLCKWCGKKPRKVREGKHPQSQYCVKCQTEAAMRSSSKFQGGPDFYGTYRSKDAKENQTETKKGRD